MASASIDQLLNPARRCRLNPAQIGAQLIAGKPVDLVTLLADTETSTTPLFELADEIEYHYELLGIQTGYVAFGFATWHGVDTSTPSPVLLYPVEIQRRHDSLLMTLDNDPAVNPVLIEHLASTYRVEVSKEQFPIPDNTNPPAVLDRVTSQLTRAASAVPGFEVDAASALCFMDFSRFHLAKDLQRMEPVLPSNAIIAAMAGDELAQRAISADSAAPCTPSDTRPVTTEFHVLDSDAEQSRVIDSAVNGESLVVQAPPGTGKSHTMANLVAALTARNQRVLFVSRKRNAIDTVMRRLNDVGLGEMILDIEEGGQARAHAFDRIRRRLDSPTALEPADTAPTHEQLTHSRAALHGYAAAIHGKRTPWNLSVFDLRCIVSRLSEHVQVHSRLDTQCLSHLDPAIRQCISRDLKSYTELGGFTLDSTVSAWFDAKLDSVKACDEALALADRTADAWTELMSAIDALTAVIGPMPTSSVPQWRETLGFLHGIDQTFETFNGDVWNAPLSDWIAATATAKWRKDNGVRLTWRRRRRLLRNVRRCWTERAFDPIRAHRVLINAQEQRKRWHRMELDSHVPLADIPVARASRALADVEESLAPLAKLFSVSEPHLWPTTVLGDWVERLSQDRRYPAIVRQIRALRAELDAAGLARLLKEMDQQHPSTDRAQDMFMFCFAQSLLDYLTYNDSRSSQYHRLPLDQTVRDFVHHDLEHQRLNAMRVDHGNTEHLLQAVTDETDACRLVTKQLTARPNRSSIRRLLAEGEPVITAAFPCIAMSTSNIAAALPAESIFDVVIVDDSGQLPIPDVVGAIARGRRTVVVGDPWQTPRPSHDLAERTPSILESLSDLLPVHRLHHHYRSLDDRLIGFAQQRAYRTQLIPFPGRGVDDCVSHIVAGPKIGDVANRAVDLAVDHALNHRDSSLGIVTETRGLARQVRQRLAEQSRRQPELDRLMSGKDPQRCVVKPWESWQGDERDVIIIALAAPSEASTMVPSEAEAFVTLASSRSRLRTVTVGPACGPTADSQDSPIQSLVDYMSAGGYHDVPVRDGDSLNPFETQVARRLARHDIAVTALRDAAGQRTGLAAMHPRRTQEPVLAIESDGVEAVGGMSVRDRHRLRACRMHDSGWSTHWVWSAHWWHDPDTEVRKLVDAYTAALERLTSQAKRQRKPITPKPVIESITPAPPEAEGSDTTDTNQPENKQDEPAEPVKPLLDAPREEPVVDTPPIAITGGAITTYRSEDLIRLVTWICQQHGASTRSDVHALARKILGFKRRGRRIDAALDEAYGAAVVDVRASTG